MCYRFFNIWSWLINIITDVIWASWHRNQFMIHNSLIVSSTACSGKHKENIKALNYCFLVRGIHSMTNVMVFVKGINSWQVDYPHKWSDIISIIDRWYINNCFFFIPHEYPLAWNKPKMHSLLSIVFVKQTLSCLSYHLLPQGGRWHVWILFQTWAYWDDHPPRGTILSQYFAWWD